MPSCGGCTRNQLICSWLPKSPADPSRTTSDLGWRLGLQAGKVSSIQAALPSTNDQSLKTVPVSIALENIGTTVTPSALLREIQTRLRQRVSAERRSPSPPSAPKNAIFDDHDTSLLLDHFVRLTSNQLVGTEPDSNPIMKFVLPWALQSGSSSLDAMLAMSGSHLHHVHKSPMVEAWTLSRYNRAAVRLRRGIEVWTSGEQRPMDQTMELLAAAISLYQFEVMNGKSKALAFQHLRAAREFIVAMIGREMLPQHRQLFGFLLEYYIYFAIIGTLTASKGQHRQVVISDSFVRSLAYLNRYDSHGSMLGYASDLFEIIATIALLKEDNSLGQAEADRIFLSLEYAIENWSPRIPQATAESATPVLPAPDIVRCGRMFQHGVTLMLHDWYVHNHATQSQAATIKADTTNHVRRVIELLLEIGENSTPIETTMLWPTMMAGLCISRDEGKEVMRLILQASKYDMPITAGSMDLLERVWAMPGPGGLNGLRKMAKLMEQGGFAIA